MLGVSSRLLVARFGPSAPNAFEVSMEGFRVLGLGFRGVVWGFRGFRALGLRDSRPLNEGIRSF